MHRVSTAALLAAALIGGLAIGAQAQTVTSTNGDYSVTFTEATTGGGANPYTYTYTGTLNTPVNGAFVNGLMFGFSNPNAIIPGTSGSNSFTVINETPNTIAFAALPGGGLFNSPADPGLSAANPTATFSFDSTFAPSTTPNALAITPSGGNNAGAGPGVGNLFVGPAAAPEPTAWVTLGLGAFALLGLTTAARRRTIRA